MSSLAFLFANDTSGTSNPGCQGTVDGLLRCLARSGCRLGSRIPLGYQYRLFSNCYVEVPVETPSFPGQLRLARAWRTLRTGKPDGEDSTHVDRKFAPEKWQEAVNRLCGHLDPLVRETGSLVVNGEGTIHHDSVGALALIGMCTAAKRLGKRVSLLNCSIFELNPFLLSAIRDHVDDLAVREPVSLRYLQAHGIPARLSADCLFLAGEASVALSNSLWFRGGQGRAIYTPGVLSGTSQIGRQTVAKDIRDLVATGREVLYYIVEQEDESLAGIAAANGARIVPLGAIPWQEVIAFLQTTDLVVSGRYHINISAALAGTPFIPLETNTPKMHGLLELLDLGDGAAVRRWESADATRATPFLDSGSALRVKPESLARCVDLARNALLMETNPCLAKEP